MDITKIAIITSESLGLTFAFDPMRPDFTFLTNKSFEKKFNHKREPSDTNPRSI
jgi:hypothetical protein